MVSQGDGTAQFVCRSAADRDAAMATIEAAFPWMLCFPLTISQSTPEFSRRDMAAISVGT
ncbi:MAG: hypothetical protein KAV87_08185 [Desulfobacteraceae bacterium]|nr:hypothetical protein [Desulfobacteraceae bacterium]